MSKKDKLGKIERDEEMIEKTSRGDKDKQDRALDELRKWRDDIEKKD